MTPERVEMLRRRLKRGIKASGGVGNDYMYIMIAEAALILQMIEEREPKAVENQHDWGHRIFGYCPTCGRGMDKTRIGLFKDVTRYCYQCGQALTWDPKEETSEGRAKNMVLNEEEANASEKTDSERRGKP